MPNRPALVGAGATGLYAPPGTAASDRELAARILGSSGRCVWVPEESALDIVTALSGSGPAYFFLLAEQLAAAAVKLGLDADTARVLAAETLYGAGALAHLDQDLAGQRAAVTSKGGTTEAALKMLAGEPLNALVQAAVSAATRRSSELADQFGNGQ
jgi:pyrroline-5-carboxylate reductase